MARRHLIKLIIELLKTFRNCHIRITGYKYNVVYKNVSIMIILPRMNDGHAYTV